jgi:hypothetical protein
LVFWGVTLLGWDLLLGETKPLCLPCLSTPGKDWVGEGFFWGERRGRYYYYFYYQMAAGLVLVRAAVVLPPS